MERVERVERERVERESGESGAAVVAEWARAWDTLTMFEATVCGRS